MIKIINEGYIVNPDEFLIPTFKISPFRTDDIIINRNIKESNISDDYFEKRFNGYKYIYTENGRKALYLVLENLKLAEDDCVTIFTTTNNFYISGCVTKEIEKFCKWSRKIESNTKVIFVNHEFGFPYEELIELKKFNLPIIEDCAHSFLSNNREQSVGTVGDYIIFSFPKYFPIQVGGMLIYKNQSTIDYQLDKDLKKYIKKVVSYYIKDINKWSSKRKENYNYLESKLKKNGCKPRFEMNDNITPGVYIFTIDNIDTNHLKKFLWRQGIENSVFYKENAMYIPVNHSLKKEELDYFIKCIEVFLKGDIFYDKK